MTHDRADNYLEAVLVSHGVEICLYVVEKTRTEGAAWDQPVKFHYSPKPTKPQTLGFFQLQSSAGLWVSSGMLTYTGNQEQ